MKRSILLTLVLVVGAVQNAAAHYTFIMPEKFHVGAGETIKIGFHRADGFPESTQLGTKLTNASFYNGGKAVELALTADGKRMVGSTIVNGNGYVVATVVNPTAVENMKPEGFTKYLKEEGLNHIVEAREKQGEADKPGRERYTMYAKTIFLAGTPNDAYKQPVGLPIEIVLDKDPASVKAGGSIPVRVLFKGAPAKGLELMATSLTEKSHSVGKTDADGKLSIPVTAGPTRLHAILMERSTQPDADWESFWATLTFEIQ